LAGELLAVSACLNTMAALLFLDLFKSPSISRSFDSSLFGASLALSLMLRNEDRDGLPLPLAVETASSSC
jgi:hypothetical protein